MRDFAAIDFETANGQRSSVCAVGVVVVRDGRVADTFYSLIRPTPNYYSWFCTRVHGLSLKDTQSAPRFPEVWPVIHEMVQGLTLVAHNSPFDEGCLRAVHQAYGLPYPEYEFRCTLAASRRRLPQLRRHTLDIVAEACGYSLADHHHALADAEACAAIALHLL